MVEEQAGSVTDPLIVAVVSVSLTLFVGVVVGSVTAWLSRRGEHAKWTRERRFDAYVSFMLDMAALQELVKLTPTAANAQHTLDRLREFSEKFPASFEAVSLLGPRSVNAAGQLWVGAATALAEGRTSVDECNAARWEFLKRAGKVLNSQNVGKEPPPKYVAPSSLQ